MRYRDVPKNGDKLSILGFGAMRLPVRMGQINEAAAAKQLYYAIDNVITDTI